MSETYEGGCLCGAVTYRATGPEIIVAYCHCASCRGSAGAAPVAWVTFDLDKFEFTSGSPAEYLSSPPVRRKFCRTCGTALTYEHSARPDHIDVTLATVRDTKALRPVAHVWVSDKPDWVVIADGLHQFPQWPG